MFDFSQLLNDSSQNTAPYQSATQVIQQRPSEEDYYKSLSRRRRILGRLTPQPFQHDILYGDFDRRMRDYNAKLQGAVLSGDIQGAEQLRKAQISELGQRSLAESARAGAEGQRAKTQEFERTPESYKMQYGWKPSTKQEYERFERMSHPKQFTTIPEHTRGVLSSEGDYTEFPIRLQDDELKKEKDKLELQLEYKKKFAAYQYDLHNKPGSKFKGISPSQQAAAGKLAFQAVIQEHPEFKEFEGGQVSGWSHPFTSKEDMDKKYAAFHEALKAKYEEIVSRYTGEDEPIKDDDDEWEQQP